MTVPTRPLPKELEPLRDWLFQHRPFKDQTLEEALTADTSVYLNPGRHVAETAFQDAVAMLAEAIRDGKLSVRRRTLKDRLAERPEPIDPPVRWPVEQRPRGEGTTDLVDGLNVLT